MNESERYHTPLSEQAKQKEQRANELSRARNHLRHPERVSMKDLLWARSVVEAHERDEL